MAYIEEKITTLDAYQKDLEGQQEAVRLLAIDLPKFFEGPDLGDMRGFIGSEQNQLVVSLGTVRDNLKAWRTIRSKYPSNCPGCGGTGYEGDTANWCSLCGGEGVWTGPQRLKEAVERAITEEK